MWVLPEGDPTSHPPLLTRHCCCCCCSCCRPQLEAYTQLPGSPQLVGYYHSDAKFTAQDLPPVGRRVADKIAERQPAAVVLLVDCKKLQLFIEDKEEHPFELFTKGKGEAAKTWKREDPSELDVHTGSWKAMSTQFFQMVKQQKHRALVDFDEHLDDVSKDYFNPHIGSPSLLLLGGKSEARQAGGAAEIS